MAEKPAIYTPEADRAFESTQLTKRDILVLAAACRKWPAGKCNYWYLGELNLRADCAAQIDEIFRARGAKEG